ncbi:unnamed protein product [Mytilus coruscus]|uniref:Uncharacterized protein n=1 Tax=Mytilus coruscus TaxID=42192 RepID=A0A6J8BSG3_MYTCO|nr:unnamed protein product [Mytilus coruscus]
MKMDCVYFPDINSITSVSHRTIDVFAKITETLDVNFQSKTADFPRQQIKCTMKKLTTYRQNMEFPELNKLFYLLTETVLSVVGLHNQTATSKKSVAERVHNKIVKLVSSSDSILPIPTFVQTTTEEYYAKVDEMNKLMRTHTHVNKELQRQQKMCWTTELSRYFNAHRISSSKLKARDVSINYLLTTLNHKKQIAAETAKRYQTLITKAQTTRNALKLFERELLDDIRFNLVERLQSGLVCLKYILATQTNKFNELLPHIDNFDCRLAAESITDKLSSKYQFSSPHVIILTSRARQKQICS